MRFSAPRSISPSPERPSALTPSRSTYGLNSISDDDSDSDVASVKSSASRASSSSSTTSEFQVPVVSPSRRMKRSIRPMQEQRAVEDTVSMIRLRTRHNDPYEEWERATRKDAYRAACKQQSETRTALTDTQQRTQAHVAQALQTQYEAQMREVEARLSTLRVQRQERERTLVEGWKERDRRLWERIEGVIKIEEEKVRAKLEEERKKREAEEKVRREAEEKVKAAEEEKKLKEELKRKEEEKQRQEVVEAKRKEEEEKQALLDAERKKAEKEEADIQQRETLGFHTPLQDWTHMRRTLLDLKAGPMSRIKANREMKSERGRLRRMITPKIGQLTGDAQSVARISNQLTEIIGTNPGKPHQEEIYWALLSATAKAILLQAEVEVTAKAETAKPLAQVTIRLASTLEGFAEIFMAKLTQRCGGWVTPIILPSKDVDGKPWPDKEARMKAAGIRKDGGEADGAYEDASQFGSRVTGMMRVYFSILVGNHPRPLHKLLQMGSYWTWFARLANEPKLLEDPACPMIIYAALDVGGRRARQVWGKQWHKLLASIYQAATTGINGDGTRMLGGSTPAGKAARVRVQLEIERIMGASVQPNARVPAVQYHPWLNKFF